MTGGIVSSNSISIVSVYPVSINDSDITVMTERIVYYNTLQTIRVEIPAENESEFGRLRIDLPDEFSIFEVKKYDDFNKTYSIDVRMENMPRTMSYSVLQNMK